MSSYEEQDAVVIDLAGRITLEEANALDAELRRLAARRPRPRVVVIDLQRLEFISSIGLGVLVAFYKTLRGVRIVLAAPQPLVRTLLRHANLHAIFTIVDTPADAWLDEATIRPVPVTA